MKSIGCYSSAPLTKYSKYFSVLLMISTIIFTDCSKSADPAAAAAPSLVGTWKSSTIATTGCTNTSDNSAESSCGSCSTYTFTTTTYNYSGINGVGASFTETGTYTTSGSTITMSVGTATSTYAVTATTLTLTKDFSVLGSGCKYITKYIRQ